MTDLARSAAEDESAPAATACAILKACARGELPPSVVLSRLAIARIDAASAERMLASASGRYEGAGAPTSSRRLREALDILRRAPEGYAALAAILAEHDAPPNPLCDPVAHWAGVFDRACARSPEASVALYSLGRADLLAAATAEVAAWIDAAGLLGRHRDMLDLGCGIGRMLEALAPRMRFSVGIEISRAMAETARERTAAHANVAVLRTSGRDLSALRDASFDLVLAVDCFPYLVAAGNGLAPRHGAEARRVLRPGGALLILNYSYRGDLARDRLDVARLAAHNGFSIARNGAREFRLWDAALFALRRIA